MNQDDAIQQACQNVGILPPRARALRKWLQTDIPGDKAGKGDGRVMIDADHVTAWNWKTGDKATVWLEGRQKVDWQQVRRDIERDRAEKKARADRAAGIAADLMAHASAQPHPYLKRKGFPNETPLVVDAETVRQIGGDYLVPDGGHSAIFVPARIGQALRSCQLIWEDGTKKFLYGGEMGGASLRIASGRETWLCEGYATGLSLRAALKGLSRADTVLVCFSASNIAKVACTVRGRCYVAADHDAPQDQFGGLGAGEHFARATGRPYLMPAELKQDVNDLHRAAGIFAVQRLISDLMREAPV